jgi:hypothetical protein
MATGTTRRTVPRSVKLSFSTVKKIKQCFKLLALENLMYSTIWIFSR